MSKRHHTLVAHVKMVVACLMLDSGHKMGTSHICDVESSANALTPITILAIAFHKTFSPPFLPCTEQKKACTHLYTALKHYCRPQPPTRSRKTRMQKEWCLSSYYKEESICHWCGLLLDSFAAVWGLMGNKPPSFSSHIHIHTQTPRATPKAHSLIAFQGMNCHV